MSGVDADPSSGSRSSIPSVPSNTTDASSAVSRDTLGRPSEPIDELRRALTFLGWDVTRERVVEAGHRVGAIVAVLCTTPTAWRFGVLPGMLVGLSVALAVVHAIHRLPVWCATLRRTRALGAAPGLVGRLVLRMRLDPSAERAVRFAARTGHGPLADDLAAHERRRADGPTSGLREFAREWRPWFPALDRSVALVRTAGSAPPNRRDRCLDRALDAVLSGTTDRLASFVGDVRGPVSALYAFGVLLPLALIALLPAAAASGVPIGATAVTVVYLVVLPVGLLAASAWLLSRRPVAFPPPTVDADHPDVPRRGAVAAAVGLVSGIVAALTAWRLIAPWTAPIAAVGIATGIGLLVVSRPRRRVLAEIRDVERGLPDAMTVIGGDVAEGVAVERAVVDAGDRLDGRTGRILSRAARRSRTLRVSVREAFLGRGGPAAALPSPRVRGAVALLSVAAHEGKPAGDVILDLADQLERLRELERESRRQLATVTGTLTNTAAVFAPLVGGATVALATGIDAAGAVGGAGVDALADPGALTSDPTADGRNAGTGSDSTAPAGSNEPPAEEPSSDAETVGLTVPTLGRIVGVYVLLLSAILTGLATGLERGFDRTLVAHRIGIALPTATTTYLVAFVGAGLLL